MKAIKWVVVLILVLLGACSKPVTENGTIEEKLNEQNPIGQNSSNSSVQAPIISPFVITDLRVVPAIVEPGSPAVAVVTVKNTGEDYGTFPVELKIDEKTFATHTIGLDGGKSANLTFLDIFFWQERTVLITCGNLTIQLGIHGS